jgi:hypothetical protein
MRVVRRICIAAAAAAVSVGLLGITAPAAEADSSWGNRIVRTEAP